MRTRNILGHFTPLLAVAAALLFGGLIILLVGENPFKVYALFFANSVGSFAAWSESLFNATPLLFTGLAVAVAFRAGLFNIGAEGQLTLGALAATWVGITLGSIPSFLLLPLAIVAAAAAGGVWAAIPGYLKARFGVHEVINTIMLNFVALGICNYLVTGPLREPNSQTPQTALIVPGAEMPTLAKLFVWLGLGITLESRVNGAMILGLLCAVGAYLFLWRTKLGFEVRAVGLNPRAALLAGVSSARTMVAAMAMSGALAGLVGVHEVLGYRHRYYDGFSPGYGFIGIAVALLGANHPLKVCLSALLFGILSTGGLYVDVFTERVSKDLIYILQAVIIIVIGAQEGLGKGMKDEG